MSNLYNVQLAKKQGGSMIAQGSSDLPDGTILLVRFEQKRIDRARTFMRVSGHKAINVQEIFLERGLYDVISQVVIDPQHLEPEEYDGAVMAGEKYQINVQIYDSVMYGSQGVTVQAVSQELVLGNHDLYYKIRKPGEPLKKIKYWIPMNQSTMTEFFIAGVSAGDVVIPMDQNEVLQINVTK